VRDGADRARGHVLHHGIVQACIHIRVAQSDPSVDGREFDVTETRYVTRNLALERRFDNL
jgi:hypothetical protein